MNNLSETNGVKSIGPAFINNIRLVGKEESDADKKLVVDVNFNLWSNHDKENNTYENETLPVSLFVNNEVLRSRLIKFVGKHELLKGTIYDVTAKNIRHIKDTPDEKNPSKTYKGYSGELLSIVI